MEQKEQKKRLLKSTLAVSGPTVLSRVLGYARDMIQAFFLGTGSGADAFTIAYIIPNLLRRLTGEGTMTAAFVPVFTQLKTEESREKLWKFANTFFFDLTLIMALLTVTGIVLSPLLVQIISPGFKEVPGKWELTIVLTRIMFPYIFLISLAALAMAILNSFHKFAVPAFTPVLFNLAIICLAAIFAPKAREPAYVFAFGVVVGGVFQLAFQLPFLWKRGMRFKFGLSFSHPAIRKVGALMVPGIFGVGITQINLAVSRAMASFLEEGSTSSLYYATRVRELTLGLFSIALSIALLPTFSELAARKDIEGMKKTLVFSFKMIILVTLPAMVGLLLLNHQIIQVLFQRGLFTSQSTDVTATCLFFFSLGLPFISVVKILASAFFSLKDTKTPVIIAFFVMISYLSLALVLMKPLRVGGIALALSLSETFNFLLLFVFLERKIGKIEKKEILASFLRSSFAAILMGAAIWFLLGRFEFQRLEFLQQLGALLAVILAGILIYVILSLLFNSKDLKILRDVFSKERILQ
ncbi:MAG: murein biosynthesis integral membrane protein MurJ [Candidatus Aminicenantes bacterium]|nr:murein biosynthesis integral membrane protein MurJ [Candidatus Aminicenantes bacterium]